MSTWTSRSFSERMMVSVSSCVSFEKATITRSTSKSLMIAGRRSEEPRIVIWPRSSRCVLRTRVDEADEVDPVLRMLEELPGDELPDLARAEDDRVLQVRDPVPAEGASRRAADGDQADREAPEDDQLEKCRVGEPGDPGTEVEDPGADGDEVEHAQELVDGRVVGPLLVVVVEAVELRAEDPARAA